MNSHEKSKEIHDSPEIWGEKEDKYNCEAQGGEWVSAHNRYKSRGKVEFVEGYCRKRRSQ